jgi:GNAT superfamily N-acetyltransferase
MPLTFPSFAHCLSQNSNQDKETFGLVCMQAETPKALLLAKLNQDLRVAEILSLFVTPDERRKGIGARLLQLFEEEARNQGVERLSTTYTSSSPMHGALPGLFQKVAWNEPTPRILFCRGNCQYMISNAKWLERIPTPKEFEVFSWGELTGEERQVIEADIVEGIVPFELSPFYDESHIEPRNSVGLRKGGKVIGWQVNHSLAAEPGVLRFSRTFVYPEFQRTGRALILIREAIRRHDSPDMLRDFPSYLSDVAFERPDMVRIYERYLIPLSEKSYRSFGIEKVLS